MTTYSHSKLSTYEQCKLKYKFRYIDKIKPEIEKTIEAHLGSSVHSTLEWLYKLVLQRKVPSLDETIVHYHEEWEKEWDDKIIIVKQEMKKEDYFERGIRFILDYYLKHRPFDDNTLELEKKINIKIEENKEIQGFIDRLVENKKTNEIEIHDYKTGGNLPDKDKIENDRQLALYSIAIKEIFGQEKKVKLVWHYLHFNTIIHSYRTNEQLEELKSSIKSLIKEIESTKEFFPQPSGLCNWCEFKNICPSFNSENKVIKTKEERENALKKYPTLSKYVNNQD